MDADEAARAAEMLGLELAVACHYLAPNEEVDRFVELVPKYDTTGRRRVVAPLVGETLVVEPGSHWIEESEETVLGLVRRSRKPAKIGEVAGDTVMRDPVWNRCRRGVRGLRQRPWRACRPRDRRQ